MKSRDTSVLSKQDARKVLFIGNINQALSGAVSISKDSFEVRSNMLDGIDAAAGGDYSVIYVVISTVPTKLKSALKVLRNVSVKSRIILLSQMYEESMAAELAAFSVDGLRIADDYLICPIKSEQLFAPAEANYTLAPQTSRAAVDVDYFYDARLMQLEKLATTDELTGLKNRRYIREFARQIILYAGKQKRRVTLLLFDIDNFKHYNDVYGHPTGDEILKQAAVLMQRSCRPHDIVGRVGGDEFAVVFWDDPKKLLNAQTDSERRFTMAEHPGEAIFIAKRFRSELSKAELNLLGDEGEGILTISGGLASFPRDGFTVQELFKRADEALLEAKRSGKNRIYLVGQEQSDIEDIG